MVGVPRQIKRPESYIARLGSSFRAKICSSPDPSQKIPGTNKFLGGRGRIIASPENNKKIRCESMHC
ncbi:hypothetical protein TNCV_259311 [Trichonephila clavipes]|uniref:Uncharacterized protein n=1 Tax=Trichonephila clavipes TaxID=2585209 RepID=A0A8X6RVY8_TRICX|nr:hypothetical protein TNCV_259311 [Trichonephila clavipes]